MSGGGGAVTRRHAWLLKERSQLKSRDFDKFDLQVFGVFSTPGFRGPTNATGLFFDTGSRLLVKPQKYYVSEQKWRYSWTFSFFPVFRIHVPWVP